MPSCPLAWSRLRIIGPPHIRPELLSLWLERSKQSNISFIAEIKSKNAGPPEHETHSAERARMLQDRCAVILETLCREQERWEVAVLRFNFVFPRETKLFCIPTHNLRLLEVKIQPGCSDNSNTVPSLLPRYLAESSLQFLSLSTEFLNSDTLHLSALLPNLKKLSVRVPTTIPNGHIHAHVGVIFDLLRLAPNLEHFRVEGGIVHGNYTNDPSVTLGEPVVLSNLRTFVVEQGWFPYRERFFTNITAPALQYLAVTFSVVQDSNAVNKLATGFLRRSRPPLRHLEIHVYDIPHSKFLNAILAQVPTVEEVSFVRSTTDQEMYDMLEVGATWNPRTDPSRRICPNLRALRITNFGNEVLDDILADEDEDDRGYLAALITATQDAFADLIGAMWRAGVLKELGIAGLHELKSVSAREKIRQCFDEGLRDTSALGQHEWCRCGWDIKPTFDLHEHGIMFRS